MATAVSKREKFSEIYSEYYPFVFNIISTKVNNKDDAKDICQEVFTTCYTKFDEIENIRKWLFGTLRNAVYQYYYKNAKDDVNIDSIFTNMALTFVNGQRDTRIIIEEAIENIDITEQERLLFDYVAVHNYSYSNIGRILGMSKRVVGYKYDIIVRKVLEYLRSQGINNIEDLL